MIIGSGFIAKNFANHAKELEKNNVCLYAAGISDSQVRDKNILNIEKDRFSEFSKKFNQKKRMLYVSTCSADDPSRNNNLYVLNKLYIEKIIQNSFKNFLIVRLPEVVGKNENKITLVNFFYNKIKNKKKFEIWNKAKRNIIDIDDVILLTLNLIKNDNYYGKTINIANSKSFSVIEIVKTIEQLSGTKAIYNLIDKGDFDWTIDISEVVELIKKININFDENYLYKVIKKYHF